MYDFEHLDHYQILGVERNATPEEIKRAYRQAISLYHPDRFIGGSPAEQQYAMARAQRITEAYRTLNDQGHRFQYNVARTRGGEAATPPAPRDHLAELYEQARDHLDGGRYVQAAAVLRQLQQLSPFYRDSAELLARAEQQLTPQPPPPSREPARRTPVLVGGGIGALVVGGLLLWGLRGRFTPPLDAGRPGPTDQVAVAQASGVPTLASAEQATTAPTALPTLLPTEVLPTAPVVEPTVEPTPEPTLEPTLEPTPEPTLEPTPEPTLEPTLEPTPEPTLAPTVEPTLEPTLAPALALESGSLVYSVNFDGTSGWPFTSGDGWSVGDDGGSYRITAAAGVGDIWSYRGLPASEPLSIGVDVRAINGAAGIVFRFNEGSYLSFVADPASQSWSVRQALGGPSIPLLSGASSALLPGDVNRLVVVLRSEVALLAINGAVVGELPLPAQPNGPGYGLVCAAGNADAEARFTNLEIRTVE